MGIKGCGPRIIGDILLCMLPMYKIPSLVDSWVHLWSDESWNLLEFLTYFAIIYESYCIFWYYLWVSLYYSTSF